MIKKQTKLIKWYTSFKYSSIFKATNENRIDEQ